jgi:hypothetical protein
MLKGLKLIIVAVQVGAVKIYVAGVKRSGKNERGDETQFTTKISGKTCLGLSFCKTSSSI